MAANYETTMQNAALARAFRDIADYLELTGENPFKTRAYRRAAEAVADYPAPIEGALENGAIEEIEGLGPATIAKTREWVLSGQIALLERLKRENPPGLLDIARVPGMGAKKVALVYRERGVDSLARFALALENGELEGLSGFGPKTIENLKTGLRRLAEVSDRLPVSSATHEAAKILDALEQALPEVRVEIAGSLRRGRETVGDLNFVASSDDTERVLGAFAALPLVDEVLIHEGNRVRVRTANEIEAELVVASRARFGSEWWFRTGSRSHVEEVTKNREIGDFESESALFEALDAAYIAPELREGQFEWEAARTKRLPQLVEMRDVRGDLHTHSTWSDGAASIRQMAEAVSARGYEYFAVTDHSKALAMANGLNAERLREQKREIEQVRREFPDLLILRGVECDILRDGTMDLDDEILSELDWVIGSVHSAFNLSEEEQTARMVRAIQNPHVDMIGHPTGRVLGARAPYDVDVAALIDAALQTGTVLEINASERLDLKDEHASVAREKGVLLCVNTDAHAPSMLGNMSLGLAVARRAWCQKKAVLNTRSRADLENWLAARR